MQYAVAVSFIGGGTHNVVSNTPRLSGIRTHNVIMGNRHGLHRVSIFAYLFIFI
jgi:hypothetical protein